MNNDSAAQNLTIGAYPFSRLSLSLSLFSLRFPCLNIYFSPAAAGSIAGDFCYIGERQRRQLYEINALRDYPGAPSRCSREPRVSANKEIVDPETLPFLPRHLSATFQARMLESARRRWSIDLSSERRLP
jgi:hypothetical protein